MTIAQKLRLIKQLSGFSQEKLAHELGVSFVTLNRWIKGHVVPREKAQEDIDSLYQEYTGQKVIPKEVLTAKKKIIKAKSRGYKKISKFILKRQDLYDSFLLSITYHSNRIEGSTLSENETARILFRNQSIPNKNLIEHLEVKNHQAAFRYLLKYIQTSNIINEALILKLHSILMNGIWDDAGFYRRHSVRIVGASVPTANYLKIPDLMPSLEKLIGSKQKDVIGHVATVHAQFEKIHPFSDGNGRLGRLLLMGMLLLRSFPPAIIREETRQLYYTFLAKAQTSDDTSLLEDFLCDAVLEGFKLIEGD